MNAWVPFNNGFPNVVVSELEINYPANKIRAATFGRGLWESDLYCPPPTLTKTGSISSGFYEAYNVTITNATASSGSNIQVRGADAFSTNGAPIDVNTSQGNVIFSAGSNVRLFVHGCDHPGNSFRQQNNSGSGGGEKNNAQIEKPIIEDNNIKFTYYPNPFIDHLHIDFLLEKSSDVKISIYNSYGQAIETIANSKYEAGEHNLRFDDSSLTPGVYFIKLDIGEKHFTKAVVKTQSE
ncbi:MAG: T9SS type A sorting domain-containing protein [Bacteroidetes bacterium]|nr:T9SS type A sorting domain-containing protein [Bacteroidota bacterium]